MRELNTDEQVVRGHGAAREERLRHPSVIFLEVVRSGAMTEDVYEAK